MYAIVKIAGQQFKVAKDQRLFVHRLEGKEGDKLEFPEVLLVDNNGSVSVGAPAVVGALVKATIKGHVQGDKVIVFKKKRRKGYQKSNGHRQKFTELLISDVVASGAKASAPKKAAAPKKETPVKETPVKEAPVAKAAPKKAAAPASTKGDDLTKIEGIGPKIAEVLAAADLATFAAVAGSTPEAIKEVLSSHSRLAGKDPSTWVKQAELAAAGKWDELKVWQDELNGGKA
ncbi:MAG: large subunit ribosomal protein L21 [Flavobacteriales bacterium]|jgi:large subunit ribosomal protein L21